MPDTDVSLLLSRPGLSDVFWVLTQLSSLVGRACAPCSAAQRSNLWPSAACHSPHLSSCFLSLFTCTLIVILWPLRFIQQFPLGFHGSSVGNHTTDSRWALELWTFIEIKQQGLQTLALLMGQNEVWDKQTMDLMDFDHNCKCSLFFTLTSLSLLLLWPNYPDKCPKCQHVGRLNMYAKCDENWTLHISPVTSESRTTK